MPSLPEDLYFEIAPQSTTRTLLMLCLSSRAWHVAASSALYRDIRQFSADDPGVSARLLQTIASNERIGRLVLRLYVYCSSGDAVRFLSDALRNMPNLQRLRTRYLANVLKHDKTCADALAGLKQLDGLSCNFHDDDVVFHRLGPLRHIRITGGAGLNSPVLALERLIVNSHNVVARLNLSMRLCKRILDGIPNSAVFARLQAIVINFDHTLPLLFLLEHQFPALATIKAKHLGQRYLLCDPTFLPALQALQFRPELDLSAGDTPTAGIATPSSLGRQLRHLKLDMSPTSEMASVDDFCSLIEPVRLGGVSSFTLVSGRELHSWTALSALRRELSQINNLRVIYLHLMVNSWSVKSTVGHLRELAEDGLLDKVVYLRLQTEMIVDRAQAQLGNILRRTSARVGHYKVSIPEGSASKKIYTSWTRASEGDGWTGWSSLSDEQGKLPWPDYLLNLNGTNLLDSLGLRV